MCSTLAALAMMSAPLLGQTPDAKSAELLGLVKQLQTVQAQAAENHAKVDAAIAQLFVEMEQARTQASRMGGAHKPPPPPKK
jgi:hypothetical protein